jgi:hypothetical protein
MKHKMEVLFSLKDLICSVTNLLYIHSNKGRGIKLCSYAICKPLLPYHGESRLKPVENLIQVI